MTHKVNRRHFLQTTAVTAGLAGLPLHADGAIPRRVLGKTGEKVSILAFGGGSRFLMYEDEAVALRVLNEAIDSGISYLDTAQQYGNGKSEERYGKVLKTRRKEVFLATKIGGDRGYDYALRTIEESLKRLQTDRVDLVHIHSLEDMEDLAKIEAGILKAVYRMREEKMARFVGMTCHAQAAALKAAIERHDLDCVQMALNAATTSGYATSFEKVALPAAKAKNLGVIAMKITGQEKLVGTGVGRATVSDLLRYSMSLPVTTCVVGMPKIEHLRENIAIAKGFKPLDETEKERIRGAVEPARASLDSFFLHHHDA